MSDYVSAQRLLSEGRLSELVGSLEVDDSASATVNTPFGSYEVTSVRVGCSVLILAGHTLTLRGLPSEAHAQMYMDEFRAVTGADEDTVAVPDFMVV